jgi:hypothetical protein
MGFNKPATIVFGILHKSARQAVSGERGQKENGDLRSVAAKLLTIWCGEGDLNPHEIAPATRSQ